MPEPDFIAWRKLSIPTWRRILKESMEAGDKKRADYARMILKDILEAPEEVAVLKTGQGTMF
jgi:hypothetical protein